MIKSKGELTLIPTSYRGSGKEEPTSKQGDSHQQLWSMLA